MRTRNISARQSGHGAQLPPSVGLKFVPRMVPRWRSTRHHRAARRRVGLAASSWAVPLSKLRTYAFPGRRAEVRGSNGNVTRPRQASVVISSRRGCNPAGMGGEGQGTRSSLDPHPPGWQPSRRAGRRSPPRGPDLRSGCRVRAAPASTGDSSILSVDVSGGESRGRAAPRMGAASAVVQRSI